MNDPMTPVLDLITQDVERDARLARSEKALNAITEELAKLNCDRCNGTVLQPDAKTGLYMGHPCPCAARITDYREQEEFRFRKSQRGRIINYGE